MEQSNNPETISPVRFEIARPQDVESIIALQKATWLATYPNEDYGISRQDIEAQVARWDNPSRVERFRDNIAHPPEDTQRLVAKEGEVVVGHCFVMQQGQSNKLELLYVLPSYHGKKIGYQLAQKGLDWLGDDRDVMLEVVKYNTKAINFYTKLGFEITGDGHNQAAELPSGAVMPEYQMVRKSSRHS